MAKAKAVAMPDFIPDEEISQYESAPDFISDEEMAGTAAPVNAAEELRAKRVRTASPQELRKIHFGENVPAGARADQETGVFGKAATRFASRASQAITGIPQAIASAPKLLYKSVTEPAQVGGAVVKGGAEAYRKLSSGTPEEVGEAAFDVGSAAIPAAKGLASGLKAAAPAGIAAKIGTKVEQAALPSTNRSKKLAYGALSERIGPGTAKAQRLEKEINTGLEPVFDFAANAKRKINNVDDLGSAAKDMAKVTDFEFNQAVDRVGDRLVNGRPVAQEIRDEITDLVRTTNPAQAENLERIAANFDRDMPIREVNQLRQEANNVLDKFYAKSPLQQEHPAIGIAAQSGMADGLRKVLYDNLDEIYVDSPSIRQMMRERGAAEGISKYASESSGAARRQGMAETNVRGPVTTPMTLGAKAVKTVFSPTQTAKKVEKFAQRPDRKISEAYKLYIPRKARTPIGEPVPLPPKQLPYRTGPDTSGVTPMSQQGAGAQFEAVSQGMGAGRPGQRQLPAFGETPGSTYQALAGTGRMGGGNLEQRLLGPAPDVQLPGGFSQLDEIQPSIERLQTPLRQDVLAGQGYNPNQMFQGGRMRDPAQQSGLATPGAPNWGGNPAQITLGELSQLPPEIQNMTLGAVLDQMGLNAQGNYGTVRSFSDTFERTAPSMNAFSPRRQP